MEFSKYSPPSWPKNITSSEEDMLQAPFSAFNINFDENIESAQELEDEMPEMNAGYPGVTPQTRKGHKYSRKSATSGYQRVFTKYSPSTETTLSPLKPSQANLKNVIFTTPDVYVDISIWIVNLSEQFFYDNSLLILNASKNDNHQMKLVIHKNFGTPDLEYFENLQDIVYLGKGAFGKVYSCVDPDTKTRYAVKYIEPKMKNFVDHCKKLLSYMAERNSIIRAMNSPFVVDFHYAFQTKSVGGLFLFFEYCIGDLYAFIVGIGLHKHSDTSTRLENNETELIQKLDKDVGVLEISLMYIFEMFCGLDFLVQSNIVHQDIKPGNLMISQTLHLKIGDFGLVYRTRAIHRQSNRLLVTHDKIDKAESSNYQIDIRGTSAYQDFEIKLLEFEEEKNPFLKDVLTDKTVFDTPGILFDDETVKPTFLIDTWAAGVISIHLLFRGFDILDPWILEYGNISEVPKSDPNEFVVHLIGSQSFYQSYVHEGLVSAGGETHRELMEFLASIFQPRQTRSKNYTKEKTIYQIAQKRSVKYIDMAKIEELQSFRERNFRCENIFLRTVPDKIRKYFKAFDKTVFPTFKNLLRGFARVTSGENLIDLTPGVIINYFH